jgi:putative aldouronate transport system permease protein
MGKVGLPRVLFNLVNYTVFTLLIVLCLYPLWYVFIYSISDPSLVSRYGGVTLYPLGLSITNFEKVLQIKGVGHALFISTARTVLGTCCTVFACMLLGYIFTKDTMPFRKVFYRLLIITMYVGGGMIPTYLVYRAYGLVNNFLVYILPSTVSAYYIILIKTFIEQLPQSLEESAFIDGAGYFTIFINIIFPLSIPIVATIAVYSAVGQWNSWFDNHLYTFSNKNLTTMQYMLYNFLNESERIIKELEERGEVVDVSQFLTPMGVRMTITMITIIPIIVVYPFLQKYFIKGILIGSIKG